MENIFKNTMALGKKEDLSAILKCNEKTLIYGLALSNEEAVEIIKSKNKSLRDYQRMEVGSSILEKIVFIFCDSEYIDQNNYVETLKRLQDMFFLYKNESQDLLTDDELLTFMREQFEGVCFGDLDYLERTCLERFSMAVRSGYRGYKETGGHGEYDQFDEETRWDKDIYLQVLKELFW